MCQEHHGAEDNNGKRQHKEEGEESNYFSFDLLLIYILLCFTFYLFPFFAADIPQWSKQVVFFVWKNYALLRILSDVWVRESSLHNLGRKIFGNKHQEQQQEKSRLIGCFVTKWTLNTFWFLFTILCLVSFLAALCSIKINYAEFGGRLNALK